MGPTKYPEEEIGDPQNTHEKKSETHKIPTKKSRPTKYPPEKIEDPQNMHKKDFGPTNYPQKHDGMMVRDSRWHATH